MDVLHPPIDRGAGREGPKYADEYRPEFGGCRPSYMGGERRRVVDAENTRAGRTRTESAHDGNR